MSTTTDLQSLIWLIHAELAAVVNSTKGQSNEVGIESIRVRMGRDSSSKGQLYSLELNSARYPIAESGWLVDVHYRVDTADNLTVPERWTGLSKDISVERLQGVGSKIGRKLNQLGLFTLGDLHDASDALVSEHRIRPHQTLSSLALSLPPMALPDTILQHSVISLISQPEQLVKGSVNDEYSPSLLRWLRILEISLDNHWLAQHALKQIVD